MLIDEGVLGDLEGIKVQARHHFGRQKVDKKTPGQGDVGERLLEESIVRIRNFVVTHRQSIGKCACPNTFNALKNQGYHDKPNYCHGKENLSTVLMLLMFLAFTPSIESSTVFCSHPCDQIVCWNHRNFAIVNLSGRAMTLIHPCSLPFIFADVFAIRMQAVTQRIGELDALFVG